MMAVHVPREEKLWAFFVLGMVVVFLGALAYAAWSLGLQVPYTVELIPPEKVAEEFKPGVEEVAPGRYVVNVLAYQWGWTPREIVLEDPIEVKFRVTSRDVIHGFEIVGTNVNVMVFPGYVAELTWRVPQNIEGKFLVVCNEYCGVGHEYMYGFLIIKRPS